MSNYRCFMKRVEKGRAFIQNDELAWEQADVGIRRKIMAYDDQLMMVKVAFEKGGIGALHHHPHVQISYVESGLFEITIGDETQTLKQGDAYHIAPDLIHGAVCMEAGVLVDVFTPKRDDFL
jgi:quercetin dioxygenase-like cupin family protein